MIRAAAPQRRAVLHPAADRPRLSYRDDLLTVVFSTWLILGLFIDGWAHNNDKPETFFTPWHAMFYLGFLATSAWMLSRRRRAGGVPVGYGLGLVGVAVFALGGVADMIWHLVFGIEIDLEALLSPSHLVLFTSALLILASPLRAALASPPEPEPSLRRFLPVLLSTTLVAATVSFFFMEFSPFLSNVATREPYDFIAMRVPSSGVGGWLTEELQLEGFASILFTTLILMGPALLLARRWRLPFGSLTVLFGTVVVLTSGIEGFDHGETVLAGVVAGLAGDLLLRGLYRRAVSTTTAVRALGAVAPVVMWLTYFGVLAALYSVGWTVELWAGITGMAALAGLALAVLMTPSPVPVAADAR